MKSAGERPTSRSTDIPLDDPSALARFGKLEFVARQVVEGYLMGQHKSPWKGSSIEFVEHRQYYPGDEIRHIDWRAYGKTGKYYIKEYEDETNLRSYLLVDASGSMAYGDSTLAKFEYTRLLAASLGHLLRMQRDSTGLITWDTEVRERIEPATSLSSFRRVMSVLDEMVPGEETSLAGVFSSLLPTFKRRSLIVILSDCFDRISALTDTLKRFRHANHEVLLLQIVAPEEEEFPFSRPTQFRSLERENHRLLVDPNRLREHYLQQYAAFCQELQDVTGAIGIDYHKLTTREPFHSGLGAYLDARRRLQKK